MIMTVIAGILVGAGLLAALGAYASRDDAELKPDPECKGALTEEFLELKRIENIGKADTIVVVDEQAVKDGSQVIIAPEGTNN